MIIRTVGLGEIHLLGPNLPASSVISNSTSQMRVQIKLYCLLIVHTLIALFRLITTWTKMISDPYADLNPIERDELIEMLSLTQPSVPKSLHGNQNYAKYTARGEDKPSRTRCQCNYLGRGAWEQGLYHMRQFGLTEIITDSCATTVAHQTGCGDFGTDRVKSSVDTAPCDT